MSNGITKIGDRGGVSLTNLDEMYKFAQIVAKSDAVPTNLRQKPEAVLAIVQYGAELGLSPVVALNSFHNISGSTVLKPAVGIGLIRNKGLIRDYKVEYTGSGDKLECTVSCIRTDDNSKLSSSFSLAEAVTAGYTKNEKYKKEPKRMLLARASGYLLKDYFADVLIGCDVLGNEDDEAPESTPAPEAQKPDPAAVNVAERAKRAQKVHVDVSPVEDAPPIDADEFEEALSPIKALVEKYSTQWRNLLAEDGAKIVAELKASNEEDPSDVRCTLLEPWKAALEAVGGYATGERARIAIIMAQSGIAVPTLEA